MKKKQLLLVISMLTIFVLSAGAQESESAKAFRARNASLIRAWEKEYEEQARLRRAAFLTLIDTIASDSLTVLSARNMELQTLPDLSRFKRLKQIRLEGHALGKLSKSTFRADSLTHIILDRSELEKYISRSTEKSKYCRYNKPIETCATQYPQIEKPAVAQP